MKRLLLILSAILVFAGTQAQTSLQDGDYVTISFIANDVRYYLEASGNGALTKNYPTDDCLWELGVENNVYTFRDLSSETARYLGINFTDPSSSAIVLKNEPTAFYFTHEGSVANSYMYGKLYYSVYYQPWWTTISMYLDGEWLGSTPTFVFHSWANYSLYIEKWEQKGAGQPTGHFNPSKIEFTYAADDAAAAAQARNVSFMIEATTESYYQCVPRPDEALLRRSTGDVDESQIAISGIYWESDSIQKGKESHLNINKYVAHADVSRTLMTLSDPIGGQNDQWQFTITPNGKSPMGLKDKLGTQTRWIDYADNVIVEYTYGEGGATQKAEMRVVRKAYHEEDLPTLTFSINPVTYTFTKEAESKVFDVVATHQHGHVIYNVDNQAISTDYDVKPEKIALTDQNLTLTADADWLTATRNGDYKIQVSVEENNTNSKRSATLTGTLHPQQDGEHQPVSFTIPLYQRGEHGGIQFYSQAGEGATAEEKASWNGARDQQRVHTAERTIYYLPNQEIELRLPEAGFSGYMRWYDYETNGDPYYNYIHSGDSTSWVRSPRSASGSSFSSINTPISASTVGDEGVSYGLYAINKADGGVLDEANPSNQAPIIKGWNSGAAHIIACDVSAYTDYKITSENNQIKTITEPTLSYRQLFHLRPASEMAERLAALQEDEYLEEYHYQAPAGKQVLLSTQYRYKKARSHFSEMCYFFKDVHGMLTHIKSDTPVKWYVQTKNADGTLQNDKQEYSPTYSAELDYLIVRSESYPVTKIYTLVLPGGNDGWAWEKKELRIARFEVEFVDIEKQGPTNKTIITQQRINTQYKNLAEINFDNITGHLPWEQASYGYVYTEGDLATQYKRGADQGAFPFYGEYIVTDGVNKDWARASAHGGTGKALYVDGTMEPGLVASITAPAKICSGQTMYCSAWLCNPAPSGWSGEGNPIFRCNIQGKNTDETEWHDAGVYFAGELLKGTGWQQIVFPIQSAASYDSTRVSIYNFATTNQGNDFMVDDITLFVSQLPIAAYQGKMACRSTGDGNTTAAAVLRLDYSNIHVGSDGYMYYQIYNESYSSTVNPNDPDTIGGYPVNLTGDAAYYHDYDVDHGDENHNHPYGSVHIPEANFNPEFENSYIKKENIGKPDNEKKDTLLIYQSVSKMLDEMAASGVKHAKAYVKTSNSGVFKWLLYVAHLVENVSETQVNEDPSLPLKMLYDQHNYTMRMAYTPDELAVPACNMQTPLHATQRTIFRLRNSDGELIKHTENEGRLAADKNAGTEKDIIRTSAENCANDLYFLTPTIVNQLAVGGVGGSLGEIEAPIYADWLVGEKFDDVYNTGRPPTGSEEKIKADAAFLEKYGYTRGQVASAIMYDMRRVPTEDEPNPNYTARSIKDLQPSAFESYQNYEIVKHLCDNGWLQLYDTTVHFYLGDATTARYWCFPIEGTAVAKLGDSREVVVKDCNEPRWVLISSQDSDYSMNLAPIEDQEKTNQQKTEIPSIKLLEGDKSLTIPIKERSSNRDRENPLPNVVIKGDQNTKQDVTIDLINPAQITFMDMEKGKPFGNALSLEAGNEYTVRLTMTNLQSEEYPGNNEANCRVGYVFVTLQIVPKTLVWTPDGSSFNGWGKNENWKGWSDKNDNGKIDQGEILEGYVPILGADVVIPTLNNTLLYPYIVPDEDAEHEHSHYPMTINFAPHHCNNIYFAPGAHIHNQHLLRYEKAFVDMQITAGSWNMVSAPLQDMVSGDMYIPHTGWWSAGSNGLVSEPQPFEVSGFQGMRSGDAAYAFWQAFYNTTVNKMTNNGLVDVTAGAEFVQSNTLVQALEVGAGYQLYGLGWKDKDTLTIRLPKPDTEYAYYSNGQPNGRTEAIPQLANRNKLAYSGETTLVLTNKTAGEYFCFGNPTMAFIDMHALYLDNNPEKGGTWSGEFSTMQHDQLNAATQLTLAASERYLPPMTSALLKVKDGATEAEKMSMSIVLKPTHLTLNNTVNPRDKAAAEEAAPMRRVAEERPINEDAHATEMMTIYAFCQQAGARTVLATNPIAEDYYQTGEDALFISTGVENQSYVTSPLNMYTVAEQVPMMADVRQGISQVPLAILAANNARQDYMQLAFYLTSNWTRTCYFCDSQTGQKIRIMDGLVISVEMPLNHEQRYYIEGPDEYMGSSEGGVTTSTIAPNADLEPKAWAYSPAMGTLVVAANDMFQQVRIYDMAGRLLTDKTFDLLHHTATLAAPTGVCIVETIMRDGTAIYTQTIVK